MSVTFFQFDIQPTHVLVEPFMPAGQAWPLHGFVFVALDIAPTEAPDSTVTLGGKAWPAWNCASPENCALIASGGPLPDDCLTWSVRYVDQFKIDLSCVPQQPPPTPPAATPPNGSHPPAAEACTCFHAPEQHNVARGCGVFTLMNGPCPCKYDRPHKT